MTYGQIQLQHSAVNDGAPVTLDVDMTPIRIPPPLPHGVRPQPDDITITVPIKSRAHRFIHSIPRTTLEPMRLVAGDHTGKWFVRLWPRIAGAYVWFTLGFGGTAE